MKVLVTGGRDYDDAAFVELVLSGLYITKIIHGGAPGADALAAKYARDHGILCKEYKAAWTDLTVPGAVIRSGAYGSYNVIAGFTRNTQMLKEGRPDLVVAFPGGRGTAHMVNATKKAGVSLLDHRET